MVPGSIEIYPSIAERELLTSEPALIESRILADFTADSINCRMGQPQTVIAPSALVASADHPVLIFPQQGRRMVEEIIGLLPHLTGAQLGRLEDEIRRERQRRWASSEGGGEGAPQIHEGTAPPFTEVLEYRPHEDGYLQLELRRYIRRDGSSRERGGRHVDQLAAARTNRKTHTLSQR
jgi:hypothetical protein